MRASSGRESTRYTIWLAIAMLVLLAFSSRNVFGSAYYTITTYSNASIESPIVILENGADNKSIIYSNDTSAKISIDANSTILTYNYSLNIKNSDSNPLDLKLEVLNHVSIERVNTTIVLHDGLTSQEEITVNAENVTQTYNYYSLQSSTTINLGVMNLNDDSSAGITTLNTCLRIRVPYTTTYTVYAITFEFT